MVWISTDSGNVAENAGPARFKLIATGLVATTTLMVNATPTEVGFHTDYLTDTVANTAADFAVEFSDPDGDDIYNGVLEVPLDDDSNGEITADIKLILNAKTTAYHLGSSTMGVLTVWDNDAPELRVSAITATVTEATNAQANFKISAEVSPNEPVTIFYSLAESHDFIVGESINKQQELNFSNGVKEVTLPIAITNDNTIEENGTITFTLFGDLSFQTNYFAAFSPNNSAVINVVDDDAPVLAIAAGDPIIEGKVTAANFMVSTTNSPNKILRVRYNLAESHNFVENEGPDKHADLDFRLNATQVNLPIFVTNDEETEPNGTITLTLIPDSEDPISYTVTDTENRMATLNVYDDESLPTIEITADNGEVTESNGTAQFNLTATGLEGAATLAIKATPTEDGADFLTDAIADSAANFPVQFTDPDGDDTYSGILSVPIDNDEIGEATGDIKLALNANPTTYQRGSVVEGVITIFDDEAPELKITAGSPVTETDNATADFTISARISPDDEITVYYNAVESQDFIASEDKGNGKTAELDFSDGAKQATLSIDIVEDTDVELAGTISVTLVPDEANPITYTIATAANNTASVNISDDDLPLTILMVADNGEVAESEGTAMFELTTAELSATTTLVIKATPNEVGSISDFLTDAIAGTEQEESVEFSDPDGDGTYSGEFPVTLHNDNAGEATGEIKLTLNANPLVYQIGETSEGVITIWDDDAPELSIADGDTVVEANNAAADFVVTAKVSPDDQVMVTYTLAESHDFISDEGPDKTTSLDFRNDATEATLSIDLTSDAFVESNGTITVTLTADTRTQIEYTVAPAPNNSAIVNVVDDDSLPEIMIDADSGDVAENVSGGKAKFKLSATGLTATTNIVVKATPAEDGSDFLTDAIADTEATFTVEFSDSDGDDTYTGEFEVELDNDSTGEATGDIKLTLNTNPAVYRLGSAVEGVLTIYDDDAPILKITAGNPVTEMANVNADFKVSAKINLNKQITVRYNLTETHDFIDNTLEGSGKTSNLNFPNANEVTLPIAINDDLVNEHDGTVTLTLIPDTTPVKYYLSSNSSDNTATITIFDDDDKPTITIAADSGEVAESVAGGKAKFKLSATGLTQTTEVAIKATPSEDGGDFLSASVEDTQATFTVEFTDPDGDNVYSGEFEVELDNDSNGEATSDIKLTLNANAVVYDLGADTEGVITIWDDDAPELVITAFEEDVTESRNTTFARFRVDPRTAPSNPNYRVDVYYNVAVPSGQTNGDFILADNLGDQSRTINLSSTQAKLVYVQIEPDEVYEHDSQVFVKLLPDADGIVNYYVDPDQPSQGVPINILDDDLPTISISAPESVLEGNSFEVTVESSFIALTPGTITINLTAVNTTGTYFKSLSDSRTDLAGNQVEISGNALTAVATIETQDNSVLSTDGSITVTIQPSNEYQIGGPASKVVKIIDDETPELTITAGPAVYEGSETAGVADKVVFTISSDTDLGADFNFRYSVDQTGNVLTSATTLRTPLIATKTFTQSGSEYITTLEFEIDDDEVKEEVGSVILYLLAKSDNTGSYRIPAAPSVSVKVYDDEIPALSIADGETATEGPNAVATFAITSSFELTKFILIRYRPDDGIGSFLTGTTAGNPQIGRLDFKGSTTATLEVPIYDDNISEENGKVSVELLDEGNGIFNYTVAPAPANKASVVVMDNDSLNPSDIQSVSLHTEPMPPLNSLGIAEVDYFVKANSAVPRDLEVVYEYIYGFVGVTQNTGFTTPGFDPNDPSHWTRGTTTIRSGATIGRFTITMQTFFGSNITVRLVDGANYNLETPSQQNLPAQTLTNTNPLVSIEVVGSQRVLESPDTIGGTTFKTKFRVSANPRFASTWNEFYPRPIKINLTQEKNYLAEPLTNGVLSKTVLLHHYQNSIEFEVELNTNSSSDGNGKIIAEIQPSQFYQIGEFTKTASITVVDDESLPTLTINNPTAVSESVGTATFKITADREPSINPLRVHYGLREPTGDFLVFGAPSSLPLPLRVYADSQIINFTPESGNTGNYVADLLIDLEDDELLKLMDQLV